MNKNEALQLLTESENLQSLDLATLQRLVEAVSFVYFGLEFQHQSYFNQRLRTTGGRYHLASHNLDFNPKIFEKYGIKELIGVIKHELCHYHLHLAGQGYQHKDADFKKLLKKTGGSRFVRNLADKTNFHKYQCINCKEKIQRKRKIQVEKFVCGKCRGKLIFLKE